MTAAALQIGPLDDSYLLETASKSALTIAAWENGARFQGRDMELAQALPRLHAPKSTAGGNPAHPLDLPGSLIPVPWTPNVNEANT